VNIASDEALHDPALAREEFFALPEPSDEPKSIEILEGFYDVLNEFNPEIAADYREELGEFIDGYNLRYVLSNECKIQLSIQGLLLSQFMKLRNTIAANSHVSQSLDQLEATISELRYAAHEERNCIGVATNLLEGIACSKTTNSENTLGRAIDGCNVFPHEALRKCVKEFYKFASDYPNIRHAGNPASRIRDLKKDDALLAIGLALSFGTFGLDNDAGDAILDGEL
jgi:hypothetical protein